MSVTITWYWLLIGMATADGISAAINIFRGKHDMATFNLARMAVTLLIAFEVAK